MQRLMAAQLAMFSLDQSRAEHHARWKMASEPLSHICYMVPQSLRIRKQITSLAIFDARVTCSDSPGTRSDRKVSWGSEQSRPRHWSLRPSPRAG